MVCFVISTSDFKMSFFQQEDLAYKKGRTKLVKQQQQTNTNVLPRNK